MTDDEKEKKTWGGISDDLRLELIQVFALGFLDALAGFEVADSDVRMGIDPRSDRVLCPSVHRGPQRTQYRLPIWRTPRQSTKQCTPQVGGSILR